ncbi:hypothetical protein HD806DRAFT_489963 [Xylariaceae sp. AK1471]|nr:hypothetical protein HD806DRAFT_489963 [Xylariaceae sp. AK1471]
MLAGINKMKDKLTETKHTIKKKEPKPIKPIYRSNEVAIPDGFLKVDPADAQPITHTPIDFENSVLPEYKGCYAVVLDNVMSPSECAQLLQLAESSVMDEDKEEDGSSWRAALVNIGGGYEVEIPDYRKSDRIIWDNQEIVDRLWTRLAAVPEIQKELSTLPGVAVHASGRTVKYDFYRVNKRLRFLKYTPGQFFKPHCDGPYGERAPEGYQVQTYMTVHLYLNDSQQVVGPSVDLVGGATSFLSRDDSRKIDVDPKAGRVLIFQHARLRHSGDDVKAGTKYTVRTDIICKINFKRHFYPLSNYSICISIDLYQYILQRLQNLTIRFMIHLTPAPNLTFLTRQSSKSSYLPAISGNPAPSALHESPLRLPTRCTLSTNTLTFQYNSQLKYSF